MTNREIAKEIAQAQAYIDKLFMVGMSTGSRYLDEFLEDLENKDVSKIFPKINLNEWNEARHDGLLDELLADYSYEGWLIEIAVPHRDNFRFKEGTNELGSYSVHPNVTRREYVYCENYEDILPKIKEVGEMVLQEDIAAFKKYQDGKNGA